jgi:GntR family transcriptional regulator of vanillate catabolism
MSTNGGQRGGRTPIKGGEPYLGAVALANGIGCERSCIALPPLFGFFPEPVPAGLVVFRIKIVYDAIEVRGELEAMAARIHAEAGWLRDTRKLLAALNQESTSLVNREVLTSEVRLRWAELNLAFHDALVAGTGNVGLIHAYEHLKRMPLVSPRAMVFEREIGPRTREQLAAAQFDHDRLIAAIDARKGQRASEIMRDHAIKSGDAKRKNVDGILAQQLILGDLGVALLRRDDSPAADNDVQRRPGLVG